MADRRLLTDRFLRALPPAPSGQRVEVWTAASTASAFGSPTPWMPIREARQGRADQLHPVRKVRPGRHRPGAPSASMARPRWRPRGAPQVSGAP